MEGYAKLAMLMGEYAEVAIFRRFSALNVQNLLYLQAEIQVLEKEFRKAAHEDKASGNQLRKEYALDWRLLKDSIEYPADEADDGQQWRTMLELRTKLKEYNDALLQQVALVKLSRPSPHDLKFLQEWMKMPDMGAVLLHGPDSEIWSKPDLLDLLSLNSRLSEDIFSRWMSERVVRWYHRVLGHFMRKPDNSAEYLGNTVWYSDAGVLRTVKVVTTVLTCLLPVATIVILYIVQDMSKRLGIVGVFTFLFSLCMVLVTDAGTGDIFAATAAFAAVQVVFISTSGPVSALSSNSTITA